MDPVSLDCCAGAAEDMDGRIEAWELGGEVTIESTCTERNERAISAA